MLYFSKLWGGNRKHTYQKGSPLACLTTARGSGNTGNPHIPGAKAGKWCLVWLVAGEPSIAESLLSSEQTLVREKTMILSTE